jgi:hypothetical protein
MERIFDEVLYFIDNMEPRDWVLVLGGVILIGYLCLKSIGSKLHY